MFEIFRLFHTGRKFTDGTAIGGNFWLAACGLKLGACSLASSSKLQAASLPQLKVTSQIIRNVLSSIENFHDGVCHFIQAGAFGNEAKCADFEHTGGVHRMIVNGYADDFDRWIVLQHCFHHLKPIHGFHVYVHEHHVWAQRAGVLNGIVPIVAFLFHGKPGIKAQKQSQRFTGNLMIIDEDDTDRINTH
jgi:hypothetical protein